MNAWRRRPTLGPMIASALLAGVFATSCITPNVDDDQQDFVYVEVWGAVQRPRVYAVPESASPQSVLALAGGVSTLAGSEPHLIRHAWFISEFVSEADEFLENEPDFSAEREWRSGDMLIVCGKQTRAPMPHSTRIMVEVAIAGGVQKEGYLWVERDAALIDLLRAAGGVSTRYHNDWTELAGARILPIEPGADGGKRQHISADKVALRKPLMFSDGDGVMVEFRPGF